MSGSGSKRGSASNTNKGNDEPNEEYVRKYAQRFLTRIASVSVRERDESVFVDAIKLLTWLYASWIEELMDGFQCNGVTNRIDLSWQLNGASFHMSASELSVTWERKVDRHLTEALGSSVGADAPPANSKRCGPFIDAIISELQRRSIAKSDRGHDRILVNAYTFIECLSSAAMMAWHCKAIDQYVPTHVSIPAKEQRASAVIAHGLRIAIRQWAIEIQKDMMQIRESCGRALRHTLATPQSELFVFLYENVRPTPKQKGSIGGRSVAMARELEAATRHKAVMTTCGLFDEPLDDNTAGATVNANMKECVFALCSVVDKMVRLDGKHVKVRCSDGCRAVLHTQCYALLKRGWSETDEGIKCKIKGENGCAGVLVAVRLKMNGKTFNHLLKPGAKGAEGDVESSSDDDVVDENGHTSIQSASSSMTDPVSQQSLPTRRVHGQMTARSIAKSARSRLKRAHVAEDGSVMFADQVMKKEDQAIRAEKRKAEEERRAQEEARKAEDKAQKKERSKNESQPATNGGDSNGTQPSSSSSSSSSKKDKKFFFEVVVRKPPDPSPPPPIASSTPAFSFSASAGVSVIPSIEPFHLSDGNGFSALTPDVGSLTSRARGSVGSSSSSIAVPVSSSSSSSKSAATAQSQGFTLVTSKKTSRATAAVAHDKDKAKVKAKAKVKSKSSRSSRRQAVSQSQKDRSVGVAQARERTRLTQPITPPKSPDLVAKCGADEDMSPVEGGSSCSYAAAVVAGRDSQEVKYGRNDRVDQDDDHDGSGHGRDGAEVDDDEEEIEKKPSPLNICSGSIKSYPKQHEEQEGKKKAAAEMCYGDEEQEGEPKVEAHQGEKSTPSSTMPAPVATYALQPQHAPMPSHPVKSTLPTMQSVIAQPAGHHHQLAPTIRLVDRALPAPTGCVTRSLLLTHLPPIMSAPLIGSLFCRFGRVRIHMLLTLQQGLVALMTYTQHEEAMNAAKEMNGARVQLEVTSSMTSVHEREGQLDWQEWKIENLLFASEPIIIDPLPSTTLTLLAQAPALAPPPSYDHHSLFSGPQQSMFMFH